MYDEFEQAAEAGDAQDKFETWHKTIVSENNLPLLLHNETRGVGRRRTDGVETAADVVATALGAAQEDSLKRSGEPDQWFYDACTPWCTTP